MPAEDVCIFTNNYLASLFQFYFILQTYFKFHKRSFYNSAWTRVMAYFKRFFAFSTYRKHSLCFLDVCWNSFRLGSLCLIEIETYTLSRACFRRFQAILVRVEGILNSKTVFRVDKLPNAKRCKRILMSLLFIVLAICLLIG